MRRTLSFAVAFAAALLPAGTASAWDPGWTCAGTSGTAYACTDPNGRTYYSDCVYLGGSSCTPVTVLGPAFTCGGPLVDPVISCG